MKCLLLIAPALLLASCTVAPTTHAPHGAASQAKEAAIFQQINAYRASNDLPSLTYDPQLAELARQHSYAMARHHKAPHLNVSHDHFHQRAKAALDLGMQSVAENVGAAKTSQGDTVPLLVSGWIKSAGHRKNILANHTKTGVGVCITADHTAYATQLFGR